jgi:GH25 family lysozyme M1 (1,4-beta-N-acetylmuramidase)
MTADALFAESTGMHGDIVPAFSLGETLARLATRWLGARRDASPSRTCPDLFDDFRQWTNPVVRPTDDTPVEPIRVAGPKIPGALYRNAFRKDLRATLALETEVVLAYDVSSHQGPVDHGLFRKAGYTVGIAKATEGGRDARGRGFVDKRFAENWRAMESEGLIRTAYHFARVSEKSSDGYRGFERDAVNEAEWFLHHYGDAIKAGMLPPVLDIEWDKKATEAGVTAEEVVAFCIAFVQTVRDKLGVWPIIYTGPNFWRYRLNRTLSLSKCPLWIVTGYGNNFQVESKKEIEGWDWFMHQHTNRAKRPDADGKGVDANYFRGSLADLRAMASIPQTAEPELPLAA